MDPGFRRDDGNTKRPSIVADDATPPRLIWRSPGRMK
jgi:hypothetical protein